uniref:Small ribosomal subunit biogenesis GTPase RsgA n=2 Tax=Eutreptiella gymnastica TaxID=73025 RepID=A0A7S1J7Y4_9EUGL|mmetsp:Transcript_73996/g.130560  ORF Transcript_73996/g.130560 Transcript_73996/m.130560 type:complete len:391 (+) Transcript_73996:1362-2534(+)
MRVLVDKQDVLALQTEETVELLVVVRAVLKKLKRRVLVGDYVKVGRIDWEDRRGAVEELIPRSTMVLEPPVANVDRLLILFALTDPPIEEKQLTHFLVSAEVASLPCRPLLVLNKADLIDPALRDAWIQRMQDWGYEARAISVFTGEGLVDLAQVLKGTLTVLSGPSGVGKSSLVNALRKLSIVSKLSIKGRSAEKEGLLGWQAGDGAGDFDEIATQEVGYKSGRGRHTTRHSELLMLPEGGLVADTPGFGLPTNTIDTVTPKVLMECFPEIQALRQQNGQCAFNDCAHVCEPGCAVGQDWERHSIYWEMLECAKEAEVKARHSGQSKINRQSDVRTKSAAKGALKEEPLLTRHRHRRVSRRSQQMEIQAIIDNGGEWWEEDVDAGDVPF